MAIGSPHQGADAHEALSALFGHALPLSPWRPASGVRCFARWRHGTCRGYLPPLRGHVLAITQAGYGMAVVSRCGSRVHGQLRRGAVSIWPEGSHGHVDFTGERECSQVVIPSALVGQCAQDAGLPEGATLAERITIADPVLFHLVDMLTAGDTGTAHDDRFREQCTALICTHLVRRHVAAPAETRRPGASALVAWQLKRIRDFMLESMHAPITLRDIAAQVSLSRSHVCTAFRNATGSTPREYLTALRIGRAKELLANSDEPIGEISAAVGYGTASAFTASFRRATGVTPRAFRERR
jgi:AraC family transcriptional regulator